MLNLKLGLSALGLEVSAWSGAWLLAERSDAALASYLLLHAAASVLLSLSLLPLLPPRLSKPRWATLLLMTACSYAVPVAGFLGVMAAFVILRLYRRGRSRKTSMRCSCPNSTSTSAGRASSATPACIRS